MSMKKYLGKKVLRKSACLLVVLCMLLSMLPVSFATTPGNITVSDETGTAGSQVVVTLTGGSTEEFNSGAFRITYDATKLTADSVTAGAKLSGATFQPRTTTSGSTGIISVIHSGSQNKSGSGVLATITFTIQSGAAGKLDLNISKAISSGDGLPMNYFDSTNQGAEIATTVTSGSITVAANPADQTAVDSYIAGSSSTATVYGGDTVPYAIAKPTVPSGVTTTWTKKSGDSACFAVVSGDAKVIAKPAYNASEVTGEFTLAAEKNGAKASKDITVTVRPELSPFQKVMVTAIAMDQTKRTNFVSVLQGLADPSSVTNSVVTSVKSTYFTDMKESDIQSALTKYSQFGSSRKAAVQTAMAQGLVSSLSSATGFDTVKQTINTEITGNVNGTVTGSTESDLGLKFLVTMLKTVTTVTGPIAYNDSADATKIDFKLEGYNFLKTAVSELIDSAEILKGKINNYSGTTNFDKLLAYCEQQVNSAGETERSAFKTFLANNGNIYQAPTSSPSSPSSPTTAPTAAPTAAPTTAPTTAPLPSPEVSKPPVSQPTPPPANKEVSGGITKVTGSIGNGTPVTIKQADDVVEEMSKIEAKVTSDKQNVVGNLTEVTNAIPAIATGANNIQDAAKKEEVVTKTTQVLAAVVDAAKAVTKEEDVAVVNSGLAKALDNVDNLMKNAASAETKTKITDTAVKAISAITDNAKKVTSETATLQVMDSIISSVGSVAKVANAAGDADKKAEVEKKTAEVISTAATLLSNVKTEQTAVTAVKQVAALVENSSIVVTNTENKEAAKEIVKSVESVLKKTNDIIKTVSVQNAVEVVQSIAVAAGNVAQRAEVAGKEVTNIKNEVSKVINTVIEKVGKQEVAATVEGSKANTVVDDATVAKLVEKAKAVADASNKLEKTLEDKGLNKNIEKKVVIDIPSTDAVKEVKAELPSALLTGVKANGVEKIEIATGVASLNVPPDFVKDADKAKSVALEAKRVEVTDEVKNGMSEEQKKLVTGDSTILNFTAEVKDAAGKAEKVEKFEKQLDIKVPYELKAGEHVDRITVLYLGENGQIQNMSAMYNAEIKVVKFKTNHFSQYVVKDFKVTFEDVADNFWGKSYIDSLAAKGIVVGKGTVKTFAPNDKLTRAEFAKMLVGALGIYDENSTTTLKDVKEKDWHYKYVASAAKANLIKGREDGSFAPNENISRQDMAVVLSRLMENVYNEKIPVNANKFVAFKDKNLIAQYALNHIALAVKLELITGKGEDIMDPKGSTTRAEAATVVYRVLNH